jgi:hypothetical protein
MAVIAVPINTFAKIFLIRVIPLSG